VLKLEFLVTQGDVEFLEMFISLNWDHQVVLIPPKHKITGDDFGVDCMVVRSGNET